ncbi:MAG: ATP-binding cassette domain-containing protein, partial [bacterium]
MTEAFAGLDRTREILNTRREIDDGKRTARLGELNGDVDFRNVSFSYEKGVQVLHNVSFTAPAGSVTALVGSSGSGKTTIAGLAASFLNPQTGTVSVDKHDLSEVVLDSYRSQLGVVLQDDFLFEGTIRQNILFGKPDARKEEVQAAVEAAHVNEFTERFEDGLETLVG